MYRRSFNDDGNPLPYLINRNGDPAYNLQPYAKSMRQVADSKGVTLIDLFAMSNNFLRELGDEAASELFVPNDRAHWNQKGAIFIASLVSRGIAKSDEALKQYLLPGVVPGGHDISQEMVGLYNFLRIAFPD